jgi:hypothetical protein
MKIHPVAVESFRAEWQTDTQEEGYSHFFAIFAKALKDYEGLMLLTFIIQVLNFAYIPVFKTLEN